MHQRLSKNIAEKVWKCKHSRWRASHPRTSDSTLPTRYQPPPRLFVSTCQWGGIMGKIAGWIILWSLWQQALGQMFKATYSKMYLTQNILTTAVICLSSWIMGLLWVVSMCTATHFSLTPIESALHFHVHLFFDSLYDACAAWHF